MTNKEYTPPTLIQLLHDITRLGYEVKFSEDFNHMLRLGYFKEDDEMWYEHDHVGIPDGGMEFLEKKVYDALQIFYHEHKE